MLLLMQSKIICLFVHYNKIKSVEVKAQCSGYMWPGFCCGAIMDKNHGFGKPCTALSWL